MIVAPAAGSGNCDWDRCSQNTSPSVVFVCESRTPKSRTPRASYIIHHSTFPRICCRRSGRRRIKMAKASGVCFLRRAKRDRLSSGSPGPQSCAASSKHLLRKLLVPGTGGRPPFSPLILVKNFPRRVLGPVDFLALAAFAANRLGVIVRRWQRDIDSPLVNYRRVYAERLSKVNQAIKRGSGFGTRDSQRKSRGDDLTS